MMPRRVAALVLLGCLTVAGCGVGDEPEPVPLTDAPIPPVAVPTVTQRQDLAPAPDATMSPAPTGG
ncbi:hypothetical protein [Pseudonocardia abyssalis]|uniref:Uncharacterized protein n=1 Tax=Pseudonocardia abyssalis TaxID=2792008 RepID=A0ABS6ULH7_9PSEU|nr:hypothetical protein [Pseudonocardia abyssalis]MBW0118429.1 hypothetical protein [Pseudonocardia abyssalis]MBW0133118.1 hypothetical protein [Pseudonocardia abyssalis]